MSDSVDAVVRDYYDALRNGEPLAPYFLEDDSTVKFGISEALFGFESVSAALEEQTETTAKWSVESANLVTAVHGDCATFADEVTMAWTDAETGDRRRFETRWSGTLVSPNGRPKGEEDRPTSWKFATMHVSTDDDL